MLLKACILASFEFSLLLLTFCFCCRNFWVLLTLGTIQSVMKNLKRTAQHLNCEFSVFDVCFSPSLIVILLLPPESLCLITLLTTSRPMVSEPINSSLFHQLAEQLQQQNLEQFQKQLLEHQQKVEHTHTERPSCSTLCLFWIYDLLQLAFCIFLQAMNIEGQDSIFGQENSVSNAQSSSQPQLPEPENKIDDSIDNQQQVCPWAITATLH